MTKARLIRAIEEAARFLARADGLLLQHTLTNEWDTYSGGPDSSSVRRASMDLTRALADLRRGR